MKNNPSLYPKWEEYMKDILIQCYMTTLTNMHHHLVPKTRDEWEKFDINCRTLRTYKLAQNLIIGHRKVPLVDPEAHIVQQNCVCLVILELLTTANNHLYMTIRDSIDQESLRSLRGRATDQVDFISTRLMYFGVKNHFLQCSVAVNRRRRHEVLRGGRMRPEEQPADWAERLDQAVDLVNRIDKSEQIGPVTKTDIFIEGIQTVTHKLDWTINLIESIDVHQRVSFDEVVQKLQDAYLAAQAKAGGQTYNPLNAVRDAHRKGHRAYLGDVQIHSELPHKDRQTCLALYDLEHQLSHVDEDIDVSLEVRDTSEHACMVKSKIYPDDFKTKRFSDALKSRKDKPCFMYHDTGSCQYGDDCIYSHEKSNLSFEDLQKVDAEAYYMCSYLTHKLKKQEKHFQSYKKASEERYGKLKRKFSTRSRPGNYNPRSRSGPTYQSATKHSANFVNQPVVPYQHVPYQPDPHIREPSSDESEEISLDTRDGLSETDTLSFES